MFGYSIIQLYFLTNMIYTIIMFFLLHNSIVERMIKNHKRMTDQDLTDEEVISAMNIFYVIGPFFGSVKLFKDTMNLIFDYRSCIWLHWLYRNKEESKEEK